jgi:hypothetical protein
VLGDRIAIRSAANAVIEARRRRIRSNLQLQCSPLAGARSSDIG